MQTRRTKIIIILDKLIFNGNMFIEIIRQMLKIWIKIINKEIKLKKFLEIIIKTFNNKEDKFRINKLWKITSRI